jgi:ubiquinone/menaquinone biosynthesis C-methylase UbiE
MSELGFTGERFIPGTRGEIWIEHWHRYHFAAALTAGREVLDVACGEGYGAALLARSAARVVGVDLAPAAIEHAQRTYAQLANLRFVQGSCTALPLDTASVDVAVSFETLEHIEAQAAFMDELARVLRPGGLLLLSCPNKAEYTDRRHFENEFHVKELYREELAALVGARFPHLRWFGQKPTFYSVIAPEAAPTAGALAEVAEEDPATAGPHLSEPLYFIVAASRERAMLDALPAPVHVLADRGEWVRRDYEKVFQWMTSATAENQRLRGELEARERELAGQRREAKAPGWRGWLKALFG